MTADVAELIRAVESREARLAVIGLGFVGAPVAAAFADAGFDVVGVDVDPRRVDAVRHGRVPFAGDEPGLAEMVAEQVAAGRLTASGSYTPLGDSRVFIIAVETPVDQDKKPRYAALRSVLESLGPQLDEGDLVIVESTLAPGTMRDIVAPALAESSGLAVGEELLLAHCPERVMPGRLLANLSGMSRVVGGVTPEAADAAAKLYEAVVRADLDKTDALTAEIVKTGENAYRDVQIAFANEMALLCEDLGADVWSVRELLNKSPGREMLLPGAGVGGHCIPKDPWLLVANASESFVPRLVPAAREINDGMPHHVAAVLEDALAEVGQPLEGATVAVLGYAYLADSDDDRNSPSAELIEHLRGRGATVRVHDPWVADFRDRDLTDCARDADALVIMTAHSAYGDLDLVSLREVVRAPIVVDGRRVIDGEEHDTTGWVVRTVGVG
ncbi:MAG: nucleotide sugar dehydrogenase [Anaerolineae bacterium]